MPCAHLHGGAAQHVAGCAILQLSCVAAAVVAYTQCPARLKDARHWGSAGVIKVVCVAVLRASCIAAPVVAYTQCPAGDESRQELGKHGLGKCDSYVCVCPYVCMCVYCRFTAPHVTIHAELESFSHCSILVRVARAAFKACKL
jgi:hypothetical protein